MTGRRCVLTLLVSCCCAASTAIADTFVETFEGGSNEGNWTFGSPNGFIDPVGGNPGAFFHDPFLDTFAPRPRTGFNVESQFTGDYRDRGVTAIGIDLVLFDVDFSAEGRPLTWMHISDNDTTGDFSDDWAAYFIGPDNVPLPGQGWMSYDFEVPADSKSLPPGWQTIPFGPNSPSNPDWSDVITDVARLQFFYGDPTFIFIFQVWDLGMDNPWITTTDSQACVADFDGDGTVGASDLAELLGSWGPCPGCPADFDGDDAVGAADLAPCQATTFGACVLAWGCHGRPARRW